MAPSGKWIEGIGPGSTVDDAVRRSLEARLAAVSHFLPLAAYLAEQNVEHVHRLRVSTRRAVAALRLFRDWLPRKLARSTKKRLKKIRRAAGDARDLDVLGQRLARDYGERRASPVVAIIARRRREVQPALARIAERCLRRNRLARKAAKLSTKVAPPDDSPATMFRDWGAMQLSLVAGEFFDAMPDHSADAPALHRFRIRAKALRYTIELVAPALGSELRDQAYLVVEELQGRLGKIQDHATASDRLRRWADDESDPAVQALLRELAVEEAARLEEERSDFTQWWTTDRVATLRQTLPSCSADC